ncbi:4-hydroxymandelate oxidase [Nocardia transvalensis]|uniref:4-hydroxymandelate oxidase n=1 Tax=Nocardia transvalensis TaxID=37333 RepID=A0A7W9PJA8_9NOCA|nr:alpha-hydroxy acid oxidase [Nocardia transvalensis]MBB5917112.1 4-hydroxymandelate oxidase [Nocardia transvalensis]
MTAQLDSFYPTRVAFGTLDEIHLAASAALPADVRDFVEGGAGREITLRANREAFDRWRILPEPMSGVGVPSTRTELLGMPLETPVLTAPFGGDALFHPDGHLAVAQAAQRRGALSIVPEAGSFSYEQVRAAGPAAARIAQLHPFAHAAAVAERVRHAGFEALCVTVDCPVGGFRTRNMGNRFDPDLRYFAGNLTGEDGAPGVAEVFGQLLKHGGTVWDWGQLADAATEFSLPWIAKGVLTPAAAERAAALGAAAIVVSNHGGRQVDPAPASLAMLPAVRAAVGPALPILFDSGVRTGSDVFLALALGADAVIIGRSAIYGLAAAGAAGVDRVLELLTEELRTLMILAGAQTVADIDHRRIVRAET